jgi:precorrin-4/cobalt-precorrin-4 C11-methyltransferase
MQMAQAGEGLMKHPISFVGAGPGDPELITVKGQRLIEEADCIVYAGSLVPEVLIESRKSSAEVHNSAGLTLEATHRLLSEGYGRGERVVRLHTGDPSLYGAIQEQMALLDEEDIPYQVVPGVSVVFAAAAELRRELTLPEVSQTVILTRLAGRTPVPEREELRLLAEHRATLAIYLSVHQIDQVVAALSGAYPQDTPVVVAHRVGWPDRLLIRSTLGSIVEKVAEAGIRRQALILVGEVFAGEKGGKARRSKLYDGEFQHGYRASRKE